MRINKYIALATGLSRRAADAAIEAGRVTYNTRPAQSGQSVDETDKVLLDGKLLQLPEQTQTILLNKPVGYVCSRSGQGSKTIYELLPASLQHLKLVGRLDKDSSGLILLTNDGELAQQLTHPSYRKQKIYEIKLDKALQPLHHQMISDHGIKLEDGPSQLTLTRLHEGNDQSWQITMHEGRNRQIRRTFAALGYQVVELRRTQFGNYQLGSMASGTYQSAP